MLTRYGSHASKNIFVVAALCSFIGAASQVTLASAAQAWPARPIRFVMPFPPGGGGDIVGRLVSPHLAQRLEQAVVIDNRGGAGGNIGMEVVAHAAPDGYTLLMGSAAVPINASLYRNLSYNAARDLAAVSLLAQSPNVIAVNPSLPARSVKELISLARSAPRTITYASGGSGTTPHLAAELFRKIANIELLHIPYKGTAPAMIAVVAGEASMIMPPALTGLPLLKAGKLRGLAVTSLDRIEALPDLPTVSESGLPGFEAAQWYGVMAPSGTPSSIIARLGTELAQTIRLPEVRAQLLRDASIPIGSTPESFSAFLKKEFKKWATAVAFSGAKVD